MPIAWSLNETGEVSVSRNGVIRLLDGSPADEQSLLMLIANIKGSYAFIRDLGIDQNALINVSFNGPRGDALLAETMERFAYAELSKDPNFIDISSYEYQRIPGERRMKIFLNIVYSSGETQTQIEVPTS